MQIGKPIVKTTAEGTVLSAKVSYQGKVDECFYSVPAEFADFADTESSNCFLVGMLYPAMRYIAEQSQDWPTVIKWGDCVYVSAEHIEDFHEAGSIVPEPNRDNIRQVFVGDYRIIYRAMRMPPEGISIRHGHFLIKSIQSL